jgi:Holliday junction resolvase RusA-like endonuclease
MAQKSTKSREPLHLILTGRIPSKKNSRLTFLKYGKIINIPSKDYSAWHKNATEQLKGQVLPQTIEAASLIKLFFYAPDKRGSDLTNKAESVMDLLVDNKVLTDDNWWVVGHLSLIFGGVDKVNPRCEIFVHYYESS